MKQHSRATVISTFCTTTTLIIFLELRWSGDLSISFVSKITFFGIRVDFFILISLSRTIWCCKIMFWVYYWQVFICWALCTVLIGVSTYRLEYRIKILNSEMRKCDRCVLISLLGCIYLRSVGTLQIPISHFLIYLRF